MTKQEAITMLRAKLYCMELQTGGSRKCNERDCDNCPYNYEQGNMGEQKQALDMAIKVLEEEPCEDCVSRKAVLDLVDADCEYDGLEVDINDLPSIRPAHEEGKWIINNMRGTKICNICYGTVGLSDFKYCPYCGAEMESEE